MRKSRFAEAQIVTILRETDRGSVAKVATKHGVSEQSIYTRRKNFGTLDAADVKRLQQLEQENARLKKLFAKRDLEVAIMKEINAKNVERTRKAPPGRMRQGEWPVRAQSVCADADREVIVALRIPDAAERSPCTGGHEHPFGAVPKIRLLADSGLS